MLITNLLLNLGDITIFSTVKWPIHQVYRWLKTIPPSWTTVGEGSPWKKLVFVELIRSWLTGGNKQPPSASLDSKRLVFHDNNRHATSCLDKRWLLRLAHWFVKPISPASTSQSSPWLKSHGTKNNIRGSRSKFNKNCWCKVRDHSVRYVGM